jgi:hypothetical protein
LEGRPPGGLGPFLEASERASKDLFFPRHDSPEVDVGRVVRGRVSQVLVFQQPRLQETVEGDE